MKNFILALFSLFSFATAHAGYQDYGKFQKLFELPVDAKNVQVQSIEYKKKVDVGFNWEQIQNCDPGIDGTDWDCRATTHVYRPAVAVHVTWQTATGVDSSDAEAISDVTTYFEIAELTEDVINGIPKVGSHKVNRSYGQSVIRTDVIDAIEGRNVIDEKLSQFCATDGEGQKIYTSCKDDVVYKKVDVRVRYLKISAK